MDWLTTNLWCIPALPLAAAALTSVCPRRARTVAASLAIGSMVVAFFLSCAAFSQTLGGHDLAPRVHNFPWFDLGEASFRIGWVLDPLSAAMLVMITFVGTLIFIFSTGYMAHDPNFTRFFCFLALFAAAMLGLVISNNLLILFMCWEVVGLASYLLIGFWFQKPSAAAAAKKAFITTRIGDVFFFLGLLWLGSSTGTLLFYDAGAGCLEDSAVGRLVGHTTFLGMAASTGISLLIFCGAVGKSGQVPLHVWLPDAMEGPTPVSALIHAATMVAAGVFLVARVYPLMSAVPPAGEAAAAATAPAMIAAAAAPAVAGQAKATLATNVTAQASTNAAAQAPAAAAAPAAAKTGDSQGSQGHGGHGVVSASLRVVTWVGAVTALFAALVAVAQTDIKRILAYSTVSQLGFMFMGLGAGGVAVGMFHLLTHAFFKALLFLGSGSVIHGCHEEQDIRRMGGLRRKMPVTFVTYAVGMMALAGVPLFFSGFWSKDEILHALADWGPSRWPFLMGLAGAFLTAFYMTRQVWYVFFREPDPVSASGAGGAAAAAHAHGTHGDPAAQGDSGHHGDHGGHGGARAAHESPGVMTVPLAILAVCSVVLGFFGTPVWPWFHSYLSGHGTPAVSGVVPLGTLLVMGASAVIALGGIGLAWWVYRRFGPRHSTELDPLEQWRPEWFAILRGKFFFDELYEVSVIRANAWVAKTARWLDDRVWSAVVEAVSLLMVAVSWVNRLVDELVVNGGFDRGCGGLRNGARWLAWWQNGQVQRYLRVIGLALVFGAVLFWWGGRR